MGGNYLDENISLRSDYSISKRSLRNVTLIPKYSEMPDVMDGHKSRVYCACFNPKSMHELISGGWDDTIQFWDVRQAHSIRYIAGVHTCGDSLDISRNGKEVISKLLILFSCISCVSLLR